MSTGPIAELVVPYDPAVLTELVERRRRLVRSRTTSLVITVVVLAAIYAWKHDQLRGAGFVAAYGVVFAISLAWFLATFVLYRRARARLAGVAEGTAIRVGPPGIELAGLSAPWSQVASVATVNRGRSSLSQNVALRLQLRDGRTSEVPMDHVTVLPASLDTAVRAFSSGRFGVDLAALES